MRVQRFWADPSIRTAIVVFTIARIALSGIGMLLWSTGLVPTTPDPVLRPYFGVEPVGTDWRGMLLGVWQRFDVIHYQRIAAAGYVSPDLAAFPPLFPLMTKLVAWPLGGDTLLAGWLVANVCALAAFVALYRLAASDFGDEVARWSVIYVALFPLSFFFFIPYTESLFLLLAITSFQMARQSRWGWAGLVGAVCALTRFVGVFTSLPIAYELWKRRSSRFTISWLAAALPPIALGLYFGAGVLSGLPAPWAMQTVYYQRTTEWPWAAVIATFQRLLRGEAVSPEWFDLLIVLVMVALAVIVWKRMPRPYGFWTITVLVFDLMQYRITQPLSGQARFTLAMFPAFIALADRARTPWRIRIVMYPSAALWLYFAGQFAMWGWVG